MGSEAGHRLKPSATASLTSMERLDLGRGSGGCCSPTPVPGSCVGGGGEAAGGLTYSSRLLRLCAACMLSGAAAEAEAAAAATTSASEVTVCGLVVEVDLLDMKDMLEAAPASVALLSALLRMELMDEAKSSLMEGTSQLEATEGAGAASMALDSRSALTGTGWRPCRP